MKNIVNKNKCDKGFIGGLSKFYRSLVGVLSGYKHFSVRRVVLLLALILTLGIGNAWGDYYYRGDKNSWGATAMTVHNSGLYEYYSTSAQSFNGDKFKISKTTGGWDYNYSYVAKGFNGGSNSIGDYGSDNCYIWDGSNGYIIVYYPNTVINTTSNPKITFRTSLYAPAFYIKHPFANGSTWSWGTMTRTGTGVYTYTGNCYTANGANVYTSKSDNNYLSPSGTSGVNNGVPAVWTYNAKSNSLSVAPAYTLTVNSGGNGTVTGSQPKGIKMSTAYDITATPSSGYRFVNWTVTNGTASFASSTSASTTVTVTGDASATIQANFEALPDGELDIVAGSNGQVKKESGSWGASASYTGINTAQDLNIYAQANTGYHFVNWTKEGDGSIKTNAANGVYSLTARGFATVTANFAENTHNVTVYYKCGSTTIKTETTTSNVGEVNTKNVSAPAISGYTFSNWTIGTGVTATTSTSSNPVSIKTKSSGTYSLTANYAEDLSTVWTLKGTFVDDFATAYNFVKKTGESAGSVAYTTVTLSANTTYRFKVVKNGSNWYGNDNSEGGGTYYIKGTTENWTFETSQGDCYMTTTLAGTYTFKIDFSGSNPSVSVYYPEVYAITGDFNSWTETSNMIFDGNVGTAVINLTARDAVYEFKVLDNGAWSGGDHTITGTTSNLDITVGGGANMTIKADVYPNGNYTFTYNKSTHKLAVTYPTSYQISFSRVPTEGGKTNPWGNFTGVIANKQITSGVTKIADGATAHFYAANAADGYTYYGWYSVDDAPKGTYTNRLVSTQEYSPTITSATPTNLYAKYYPNDYTVTLDKQTSAPGHGSDGSCGNQTVTYHTALPAISGTMPSGTGVYGFMGFFTETGGEGTKVINADGTWVHGASGYTTADGKWDGLSNVTLYAYYKQAEITAITLSEDVHEPVAAGGEDVFVTAEPTIAPNPVGTVTVCWELRYSSNGNLVDGVEIVSAEDGEHPNKVKFAINGLATGSYKLHAVLRLGSGCSGTELSTFDKTFRIASDYTVTVKYMCGDVVIKTQTTTPGSPINWTDITAPDVIGYSFSKWKAGDGITIQGADANGEKTTAAIKFKADYDGTLTANYTRKRTIYFNNTLGWSDVYVYFYNSNEYWSNTYGSGAQQNEAFNGDHKPYWEQEHGHMTRIEGTNIWYYDCSTTALERANVVFTEANQHNYQYFNKTKAARRGDYSSALPMFVPLTTKSQSVNNTDYYNNGYWMNYPENTGYILHVYDRVAEDGAVEVASMPFEFTENKTLPMSLDVLLDAAHTYGFKIERADGAWFGNNATMKNGASGDTGQTAWEFKQKNDDSTDKPKCGLLTTAASTYTFTLNYANKDGYNYVVGVHYPNQAGDLQILYNDRAAWSLGTAHTAAWVHPSRLLTSGANKVDTISFFVAKDNTPALTARKIKSITAASGAITWEAATITSNTDLTSVSESGVYNFKVTQNAAGTGIASIENIGKYEGDYYIRCGALNSKWGNFRNDEDHLMTYSAFSESSENSFGDKFSHYKAKWCPRGTNVMFCIANDYSLCITDTLIADVPNTYNNIYTSNTTNGKIGDLKAAGYSGGKPNTDATADQYSANIRFMWNRHTNKISRAYVASSTNTTRKFLMLKGCNDYLHSEADAVMTNNETLLQDDQNWIYEVYVKARPGARVKLYACYGEATANEAKAQYFRGTYDSGNCGTDANSIQILGGSGSSYYKMRVIYDFKTNRLVSAWLPDGTDIDQKPLNINADVMIIRDHQNPADAITLTSGSSLGQVKTVYGVMRFNRWTLNNRYRSKGSETVTDYDKDHSNTTAAISEHHAPLPADRQKSSFERNNYFISFPFDVRLSEVFGFGTYGTHWIISEYKGKRRAERGYFIDNCINEDCTNWDYVIPDLGYDINSYVLKKNNGYLLSLDLDLMQYDDTTHFWLNQIQQVELFFPSSVPMETITSTNVTMPALGSEYECKINYDTPKGSNPEGDRRVKDSYWRCIGVPSYASYGTVLKNESNNDIQWQANYSWEANPNTMPFLYEWNTTDNTLTPQSTKNFTFKPMHAYLVQCKNEIHWTAVNATPASIVARQRQEPQNDYTWTLLLENGDDKSETFIRLTDDEQVTDTFDFGQDMYKEFRDGFLLDENGDPIWDNNIYNYKQGTLHSDLYSLIGTERVAANSLPLNSETTTIVPLGVRAKAAGEYSISLPDGSDGVGVTLVDSETGTRTNLSAGLLYTIDLPAGQTENRLYLEISPVKHTATGIGETDSEPVRNAIRKVLINGILYIVRDGQLYTVTGARVE